MRPSFATGHARSAGTPSSSSIRPTRGAPPGYNCPCFGGFDQLGVDLNGFSITTSEFPVFAGGFNGTDIWAMSKEQLVDAADLQAPPPPVARYAVTADQFGLPYHVSPSQTPPDGSYFPDSELFVESNSDANVDNHLLVYAMTDTKLIDSGRFPPLAASQLTTEEYTYPQNAAQNPAGTDPAGTIDTDFNAIQEVTDSQGILYAELDSGGAYDPTLNVGTGPAQVEWFILDLEQDNPLSVELLNQGIVSSPGTSLMYPDIAVDRGGRGRLPVLGVGPEQLSEPGLHGPSTSSTGRTGPPSCRRAVSRTRRKARSHARRFPQSAHDCSRIARRGAAGLGPAARLDGPFGPLHPGAGGASVSPA